MVPIRPVRPNVPRALPPHLDPDEPGEPRNPLFVRIQAVIDQFGVSPPAISRSRRHGYVPFARQHVEMYLSNKVLGMSVRKLAKLTGKAPGTIAESIKRGKALVQDAADRKGFSDPDPPDGRTTLRWALDD